MGQFLARFVQYLEYVEKVKVAEIFILWDDHRCEKLICIWCKILNVW